MKESERVHSLVLSVVRESFRLLMHRKYVEQHDRVRVEEKEEQVASRRKKKRRAENQNQAPTASMPTVEMKECNTAYSHYCVSLEWMLVVLRVVSLGMLARFRALLAVYQPVVRRLPDHHE